MYFMVSLYNKVHLLAFVLVNMNYQWKIILKNLYLLS